MVAMWTCETIWWHDLEKRSCVTNKIASEKNNYCKEGNYTAQQTDMHRIILWIDSTGHMQILPIKNLWTQLFSARSSYATWYQKNSAPHGVILRVCGQTHQESDMHPTEGPWHPNSTSTHAELQSWIMCKWTVTWSRDLHHFPHSLLICRPEQVYYQRLSNTHPLQLTSHGQ